MHPGKIIEDEYHDELGVSLVDYICYKNSRSALHEIRQWIGDKQFLDMLNLFSGSYILIPPSQKLLSMYYNYMAALALRRIQIARKNKDLAAWTFQEGVLHSIAKKTKKTQHWVYLKAMYLLKQFEKIRKWNKSLDSWRKKYNIGGKHESH